MRIMVAWMKSVLVVLTIVFLAGCKASPSKEQSSFLGTKTRLHEDPTSECYHRVWIDEEFDDWDRFTKVYIAQVNTTYLRKMEWWNHINTDIDRSASIRKLGRYMRRAFIEAHKTNPEETLKVVDKPDKETLILKMAVTEVIPTKVWINLVGYALIWTAVDQGVIAMEGKVIDGGTGKILAMFMDREKGRTSLINVKDLTWYEHGKSIIREWADQSVELVNADEDDVVADSLPFTLLPW